jgi:exodeoxyribonuclease VIII
MKILNYTPGMVIEPPCLILNMPANVYHCVPDSISKSGLDRVALSPAHYRYQEKREPTRHMAIGSAIHSALLTPELYEIDYLRLREVTVRTASEYKSAVKEWPGGGDFVLTGPESAHVDGMQACVMADNNARELLAGDGYRESSLFVRDPVTNYCVRVRFDFLAADPLRPVVDLKKTQDCRANAFERSVVNYRYHVQAALYLDALEWATGQRRNFVMLALEEKLPHALKPYVIGPESLALGRKLYRDDLNKFVACTALNAWPCYDSTPEVLELPDWALGNQEIITGENEE